MRRAILILAAAIACRAQTVYELRGKLEPAANASVWLHGATAPFEDNTLADGAGRFHFRGLPVGAYTLGVFVPGRGEARKTVEVGPGHADNHQRVEIAIALKDEDFASQDVLRRGAIVSAQELAIPARAHREYEEAKKRLARRDVTGAVAHFTRAAEIAPRFSAAWNHLGTIAYQAREYPRAEDCFRKALEADPAAYEPLVNLGGVSLNLKKYGEALPYNLHAVLTRPADALANSQLGMNYFFLGKLDLAEKYLMAAVRIDPAHFSHPQLVLAEIALRRQDRTAAVAQLAAFLQYHPDAPEAAQVKGQLVQLRSPGDPAHPFAATGMARTYSLHPRLKAFDGASAGVVEADGHWNLRDRDADGKPRLTSIDATIGSGRHFQMLLHRGADETWQELPLAWYAENGGHYGPATGFGYSAACLNCHARDKTEQAAGFGCASCHAGTGAHASPQTACFDCHPASPGANTVHGKTIPAEETLQFNSAGYRLAASRCAQQSEGKLKCTSCHPPHGFSRTAAEVRMVCRSCHPTTHNGAELECTRCHMPKRPAAEAGGVLVVDHRIQRPL